MEVFKQHSLIVGDTVRFSGLGRHPFAGIFLKADEPAKVIRTETFGDMPVVFVAQDDKDDEGVAFADEDLDILVKMEAN